MRTTVPKAFQLSFSGPEGPYRVQFTPTDDWDGVIDVTIGGYAMRWDVDNADKGEDGRCSIGGMTTGTEDFWNDRFWFELRFEDTPPVIQYWGDKIIWREDAAIKGDAMPVER
ncbi:MAG: hypothetical protein M3Q88_05655 [Pseudomonadota bacterium]|nr:hypothetical protein [Pseudomonadota bacterium]